MIKKIKKLFKTIIERTQNGFYYISLVFSTGFFFYFYGLFWLLDKIIPCKLFKRCMEYFKRKQKEPSSFLVLVFIFLIFMFSYIYFYVDNDDVVYVNDDVLETNENITFEQKSENKELNTDKKTNTDKEFNLYRNYSSIGIDNVNFSDLKAINEDVVAWIMVDGTNINYPVVKTDNNDYYLNHTIEKKLSTDGWVFMDYRNSINLSDKNTIFYGHNLLNKTAFGSLSNIFTDDWFNKSNHLIVVLTENGKYIYEIFSYYKIEPEVYYLKNNILSEKEYLDFLNTLKERSLKDFNISLNSSDKIITLSTCTSDNMNRRVVHAKLIK